MSTVIEFYRQLKDLAQQSNHRQLCCLQGEQSWCFEQATVIVDDERADYQWCGESPTTITTSPYSSLLGQDVELLFLNMLDGFDANKFAAAEGSVSGGGIIVLLLSDKVIATDLFYQYITKQLALHEFPIWQQHQSLPAVQSSAIPAVSNKLDLAEQKQAIQHIIKTVTGHRRRPLVLTANRGRGKSAALGIAAATLINKGLNKILVCAPSKQSVSTLYKHATLTLTNKDDLQRLQFIAPDALAKEQAQCDLLLIDEAAAIPIKLLTLFTERYSRLVFATTQFGYEGSGRGFALRFQQKLHEIAPEFRSFHLNQAIRWSNHDPVEAFTLSALCLKEQEPSNINALSNLVISEINKQTLLKQPALLNQIFSLLVNAHYQTKPSDLAALLNDSELTIIAIQQSQLEPKQNTSVLGVALINHEGGFDSALCEQIYQGTRRPHGHLVAQSLTFHSGFIEAGSQRYARLQRIAIQPTLQNKTLGSQLLTWIINWAKQQQFDHLCASFAASDNILRFWLRHQLQVLRIGTQKDKSSGEHSFIVNHPLTEQGKQLHHQIQTEFNKQVKIQLSRQLNQLDASLILALWPQIASNRPLESIRSSLSGYINANRGYESVEYLLIELLMVSSLETLNKQQQRCVIEKIIQNHSWQEMVQQHHFTGQKQAQAFLKNCICDLLTQY
ncbi:GNAT family N-acetyltransferase [Psychromonas algicola]|uniref:GNAT family N-acetyltransferase n=1 Tax=Psychromonas algicola TaxID=2555642 RepID=UPI001FB8AEC7|nr:GNAT family N-acetyltransferase [Psychromonas sp. RZ5]